LIAIGDLGWRDYEITVPITIHDMDPAGYEDPSFGPAVGILFRWSGHTHSPVSCTQPDCGYQPYGAIGWYRWPSDDQLPARLQIDMNTASNATDNSGYKLIDNTTYIFKMSVQTLESRRSQYKLKVWPQSSTEPTAWNLQATDVSERDPTAGSILLLAHHVEATFGNVEIRPLGSVVESNIASDDFNRCMYDNGLWNWQNPSGDASIDIQDGYTDDARLAITVSQGQNHIINVSTNSVPKIIQPINDGDFHIEIKIDSLFSSISNEIYPLNGIVVADNDHSKWIQVETRAKPDGIYLVVISYEKTGSSWLTIPWLNTKISQVPITPISLSVSRYGSRYLVGYQLQDQPWVQRLTFPLHQAVTQTYVYAGNYGGSQAPAHTTLFDYFLNTSDPFSDEDGQRNVLISQTVGNGSIQIDPNLSNYNCDTSVSILAQPDPNWSFTGWEGDIVSNIADETIIMDGPKTVKANFTLNTYDLSVTKTGTGTGTVTSSPAGINCGADCSEIYGYGTKVTLTAVASTGSTFTGWSGAECPGIGTCVVTMDEAKTVTANFVLGTNILSVVKTGTGSGTITSNPPGIDCGDTCDASFDNGSSVTLTAVANTGSTFTGWSGAECPGTGICVVTISNAKTVTANFTLNTYALSVTKTGTGNGTVTSSPTGINCGADCSEIYGYGTKVTLTAVASTGSTFTGWSGAECPGTGTCVVTISNAKTVTANFTLNTYALSVTKTGTGNGTVTSSPTGINCGADCSETYGYGTKVTLTAVASTGSTFTGWSGAECPGTSTCVVTIDAAKAVSANFVLGTNILSVEKTGTGSGTVTSDPAGIDCGTTCAANFYNGTTVTLAAVASTGSTFTGWSGADCSGTGTCVVTINNAKTVIATFDEAFYKIKINILGAGLVNKHPFKEVYAFGDVVTITATPYSEWFFEQWVNSEFGNSNPLEIHIEKDYNLTALFSQRRIYLPLIIK